MFWPSQPQIINNSEARQIPEHWRHVGTRRWNKTEQGSDREREEERKERRANARLSPLNSRDKIRFTTYLHANLHLQKGPAPYDCSLNCAKIILRLNKSLDMRIDAPEESDGFVRVFSAPRRLIDHYSKKIHWDKVKNIYVSTLYLDNDCIYIEKCKKKLIIIKINNNELTIIKPMCIPRASKDDRVQRRRGMKNRRNEYKHRIEERDGLFCKEGFRWK